MIDVRGKLKPADFKQATKGSDSITFAVGEDTKTLTIAEAKTVNALGEVDSDIVINDLLLISKDDYVYWWSTNRRLNKLFTDEVEVKRPIGKSTFTVGCAELTENGIEQLKVCEGTEKELIEFINEQLTSRHLHSFGNDITVFKFDYKDDDKLHPELWLTIEELAEKGDVVLQ